MPPPATEPSGVLVEVLCGQQRRARGIGLAAHTRARRARQVVQGFLELGLDTGALFLDHQHFLVSIGEGGCAAGLQRPAHADLVDRHPHRTQRAGIQAEVLQRLHHILVRLADCDDAEAALRGVDDHLVDPVGARPGPGRRQALLDQAPFELGALAWPGDARVPVQAVRGRGEIVGRHENGRRREVERGRRFDHFGTAVSSWRARSRRRCSIGSSTRAWIPVRKTRPSARA
jgi:hypothetical protein